MIDDSNAHASTALEEATSVDRHEAKAGEPASAADGSLLFLTYEEFSAHNGLNTRMRGIARALAARGRRVEIASPVYGGRARVTITDRDGIRIHMVPVPDLLSKWRIPIVSRALSVVCLTVCMVRHFRRSRTSFAWLQAEQLYPFPAAYLLARRWGAKVILDDPSLLGLFVDEKLKGRRILRPLLRRAVDRFETSLFRRAHCILCSCDRQAAAVGRRIGTTRPRVHRMCNGVDLREFAVASKGGSDGRIFFNCSLPYYQNVAALRNLLRVFSHFDEQGFHSYSAVVAVNDAGSLPPDLAAAIGANPKIRLLSNQASIVLWIQSCDLVLLPYEAGHTTTAGPRLKVFEALACGKIVLSTQEGLDEAAGCVDGRNVILCDDWLDMARKAMALIQEGDSDRKRTIRQEARRLVETEYSWQTLAKGYEEVLNGRA